MKVQKKEVLKREKCRREGVSRWVFFFFFCWGKARKGDAATVVGRNEGGGEGEWWREEKVKSFGIADTETKARGRRWLGVGKSSGRLVCRQGERAEWLRRAI